MVAAIDRVDPLGAAEVLDRQRRAARLHEVRVRVDPALRLRQVGDHVPRPGGEHERPVAGAGAGGSEAKWRASSRNETPPFSSANPWPSVWVLKISVSSLRPGRTAVIRVGRRVRARRRQRQRRRRPRPAARARSDAPGVTVDVQRRERLEAVGERDVAALQRGVRGVADEHHAAGAPSAWNGASGTLRPGSIQTRL